MSTVGPGPDRPGRGRADRPLWRQAAEGLGLVTAMALATLLVGLLLAVVVSALL